MNLPSREECEGWDQAQVAFLMSKNKMHDCVPTVNRLRINGHRLLNLSDSDMSKFSLIHQPQLQKIVQDIKKNDGSLLNKLRRLKSKPLPKVPARDYRGENNGDDQLSEPDYDNETYDEPREDHDDSYEPPPSHRAFTTTPSASFQRGVYLDQHRNRPSRPPRKPLRPGKASKQLPPEPTHAESDEDDYIDPDGGNDDDNYIEPEEPSNPLHGGSRAGRDHTKLPKPLPECPFSPDVYEVPNNEEDSLSLPGSRLFPFPTSQSNPLPPKPSLSPRVDRRGSPSVVQEPTDDDEYEVCDQNDSSSDKPAEGPPLPLPKPLPRQRSPKPPSKPRPDLKPREFESRTLPAMPTEQKPSLRALTLDSKRPKIPLPNFSSSKPANRGSVAAEDRSTDENTDMDVYRKSWYANDCDRRTADDTLLRANKDGAFMVRKSSGHDTQQPYTLVVLYKGRVYNIPIRFIPATQQFALGREKKGEEYFSSISHIIENHQRNQLMLIDSQSNTKDATKLCYPVKP